MPWSHCKSNDCNVRHQQSQSCNEIIAPRIGARHWTGASRRSSLWYLIETQRKHFCWSNLPKSVKCYCNKFFLEMILLKNRQSTSCQVLQYCVETDIGHQSTIIILATNNNRGIFQLLIGILFVVENFPSTMDATDEVRFLLFLSFRTWRWNYKIFKTFYLNFKSVADLVFLR